MEMINLKIGLLIIIMFFTIFELSRFLIKRNKNKKIDKNCSDLKDKLTQLKLFCKTDDEYIQFEEIINHHIIMYRSSNGKYVDIKDVSKNLNYTIEILKNNMDRN